MIEVNGNTYYLPKNHEVVIDLEEGKDITISAWGYYYSYFHTSDLCNNESYLLTTAFSIWFTTALLSLLSLSIVLGVCGLIPGIVSSSLLLIYVFLTGYYSTVKRKKYFKLSLERH